MIDDQLHLTDEQFASLLSGSESPAVEAHLAACTRCAQEALQTRAAVAAFSVQSKAWSERRASTHPVIAADRRRASLWARPSHAWAAAALLVAVALGTATALHHRHDMTVAQSHPLTAVSPATLKSDNDLLSAIDGELRVDESTSATAFRLSTAATDRTKSPRRAVSE